MVIAWAAMSALALTYFDSRLGVDLSRGVVVRNIQRAVELVGVVGATVGHVLGDAKALHKALEDSLVLARALLRVPGRRA